MSDYQELEAYVSEAVLWMDAKQVPENPHMNGMPEGSIHFHITLKSHASEKSMTLYYSVGPGIVEQWFVNGLGRRYKKFPRQSYDFRQAYERAAPRYKPTLQDVLMCLHSDWCGGLDCFEDWAGNYGYDSDSRKAEQTFKTLKAQARMFERMVGSELFQKFVELEPEW